jgi:DNA polymerase-3 subunit delta
MPALSPSNLRKQIAAGQTGSLYALIGGDDVEKSAVAAEFSDMIDEGLRAFNVDRLYGGDMRVDDLLQAASTLPMMAPRRLVVVLEAEKLLIPKREGKAADQEQERLEEYLVNPFDHATVVFVCGTLDLRRRTVKTLIGRANVVDCGTIEDAHDAERWVKARAARDGLPLDVAAARALVDRAGLDIVRLRAGLERLALYSMGQPRVSVEDVREAIPAGPEAQADFGIAKAIWRSDTADALRELKLALDAGAAPVMIMGQLRVAAEKMPSSQLKPAIEAVLRTDLALKSSGGDPTVLLEWLVVELAEAGRPTRLTPPTRPRSTRSPC